MFLKQIKIYGFKSFADKTEIDLCPNINGIVGPNGSGKSNIIDAVRWVLGEQSIKSLRGETASDVIFSGSISRKQLNSAYVSLVFDNTDKSLPIDYNEVSIKRVMYRSGETEYYLNNERCRLKDINELLTEIGASKESFNIISQGKIDDILSTKPEARRGIFESAAGVLKYKKRKEEAIKKLERTNANLDRVNDIISELETNLLPLSNQCENAKKYLEAKEKLKEQEISLIVYDVENFTYESKELKEKLDKLNDEIVELSSNSASYDVELLKDRENLKQIEDNINNNQIALMDISKKIENIDADIRVLKERKKYAKPSSEIENSILKLQEDKMKLEQEFLHMNHELELENKKIENIEDMITQNMDKLHKEKEKKKELETNLHQNKRTITDIQYKIEYIENNITHNSSLPNSVKSILENPRFDFVHNTIGNLINVLDKYSICLTTALGSASNYLVVNTSENAKELVLYLKENNLGRATFFPLEVIKERYLDMDTLSKLSNIPSFIGTLDKLVSYDKKYDNIIKNQMGNVIVAKDINGANYISNVINHKYKIVTLDGQIVNVGGSVTGGSQVKGSNIIKDKHDLDENRRKLDVSLRKNEEIENEILQIDKTISSLEDTIYHYRSEKSEITLNTNKKKNISSDIQNKINSISNELKDLNSISNLTTDKEEERLMSLYYKTKEEKDSIIANIDSLKIDKEKIQSSILETEQISKKSSGYIQSKEKNAKDYELRLNTINFKIDNMLLNLSEEYNMTFEHAKERYHLEIDAKESREIVSSLKNTLKNIGYVNLGSIEEYTRVKERYDFLTNQRKDLKNAEETLLEIIQEMDGIMADKFLTTFEKIRKEFKIVFREMFKGGDAELILTDPDHILETGIEIKAVPSGKTMKSLSLLSGGEKTFTAISLLFAILNIKPVPFCLLDEVEAALDDANVESFGNYLDKYRNITQFILITHKKKTMEFANTLYGITMQESGVSKLVSVKLEDIKKEKEDSKI